MADIKSPTERYKAIADAIREKNGTTGLMHPADMPQAILDIVSGGGANYESIVYNEDNTITLTYKDGVEHTMSCTYEDGKLIGVTYDGKAVELTYDGNVLVKVGKTAVDLGDAQTSSIELLDHTVKFMVDGEPYEVVSVKDGNSVTAPSGTPVSDEGNFDGWSLNGESVSFPFIPTEDVELTAIYLSLIDTLYECCNITKETYPYIFIVESRQGELSNFYKVYFSKNKMVREGSIINTGMGYAKVGTYATTFESVDDIPNTLNDVLQAILDNMGKPEEISTYTNVSVSKYMNITNDPDLFSDDGTWIYI